MTKRFVVKVLALLYSGSETIMEYNPKKALLDQFILAAPSGMIPEQLIFYSRKI